MIDNNLLAVSNSLFKNRIDWKYVTEQQKIDFFFIVNRFMSKKYPDKSQLFNDKLIDKVSAMDMWFIFMANQPYPKWFWSKSSSKEKSLLDNNEIDYLMKEFSLRRDDIDTLLKFYPDVIKEEVKFFNDTQKTKK